jgi:hypothetical protein
MSAALATAILSALSRSVTIGPVNDDPDLEQECRGTLEQLRSAVRNRDQDRVADIAGALDMLFIGTDTLSIDFIDGQYQLFDSNDFLATQTSWKLLHTINSFWELFAGRRTEELRNILVATFDRGNNWMNAFVIAEILGERYPDLQTLVIFENLSRTAKLPERALVPHGIEYLADTTADKSLRERAIALLEQLQSDASEQVRDEVSQSLRILKRIDRRSSEY